MSAANTGEKQGGQFRPGQSGNPAGRPLGARNKSTVIAEALLDGEAEAITRKCVDMALAGDPMALRLCLERILPPRKERSIHIESPKINVREDALEAMSVAIGEVMKGNITTTEAAELMRLLQVYIRSKESVGFDPLKLY